MFIYFKMLFEILKNTFWLLVYAAKKVGLVILAILGLLLAGYALMHARDYWLCLPWLLRKAIGLTVIAGLLVNHFNPDLKYITADRVKNWLTRIL